MGERRKRRTFSEAFKAEAVRLVETRARRPRQRGRSIWRSQRCGSGSGTLSGTRGEPAR
jgi:hypothetical protein